MLDKILIIGVLVGNLTVTSYQSLPSQTDSTPFNTSTNEKVYKGGAAISRDLLCGACRKLHRRCQHPEYSKKLHYDDYILVGDIGIYKINDAMGLTKYDKLTKKRSKIIKAVDLWVPSYAAEKAIGMKLKSVYKLNYHE